jgi:hypothetical protein
MLFTGCLATFFLGQLLKIMIQIIFINMIVFGTLQKMRLNDIRLCIKIPQYVMSDAIANWPGNRPFRIGKPQELAPFYDQNKNGRYEPFLGDYPLIRGDEAVLAIFNDVRNDKTTTRFKSMGAEVQVLVYSYDSIQSLTGNNALFINYSIHNKSSSDWDSLAVGLHAEESYAPQQLNIAEIDSIKNTNYYFSAIPDRSHPWLPNFSPAYFISSLSHRFEGRMSFNHSQSSVFGRPEQPEDYYNFMRFRFKNGLTGHQISPINDNSNWKPDSLDNNPLTNSPFFRARERTQSIFITKHMRLEAGGSICFDAILFVSPGIDNSINPRATVLQGFDNLEIIRNFYADQNYGCGIVKTLSSNDFIENNFKNHPFPNPTTVGGIVNFESNKKVLDIQLISILGNVYAVAFSQIGSSIQFRVPFQLAAGLYVLTSKYQDGTIGTSRIVIR